MAAALSTPRTDPTSRTALDAVTRDERREPRLWVSIELRCGEQLLAAFLRCANAVFTGREGA